MDLLQTPDDTPVIDPNKDYLAELTGPGGKFDMTKYPSEKDAYKALARAKAEADFTIQMRNKAQDELRADYLALREQATTGPKLQEQIDRLIALQQQNSNSDTMQNNESQEKPVLRPEEFNDLFSAKIQEYESTKKAQENFNRVQTKLKESFGENYANVLAQRVESMPGITSKEVNELATKSPEAFFRLMGLDQVQTDNQFQTPIRNNQRSDSFAPKSVVRNEEYYDNLRRTDKKTYYDPKTQVQMHTDAQQQGRKFFKSER